MLPPKRKKETRVRRDGRVRSSKHLAWIRTFACCVPKCNEEGRIQAHHVEGGDPVAMGKKAGDDWTVSMCADHHHLLHSYGPEWFQTRYGVDLLALAQEFASTSPALKQLRQADTMKE